MDNTLDSFIERISVHNSVTWFHNLKFDGMFIFDWLFRAGYVYQESEGTQEPGTFKSLIDGLGKVYSITVRWYNGHNTEFRDSYKKLPMTVAKVATSFELPESKGEIDYELYRAPGHELTAEEKDYLRRDVSIIAEAMSQVLAEGMTRLTVASDSLAEYKRLVDSKMFRRIFPAFGEDMDAEIRRAYRGGFTYSDPRFRGCLTRSGLVLDVNSLYPSVMKNNTLPYGEPQWCEGKVVPTKERPLTIFSITFTAKLKPNHIPCIQIKGSTIFGATEYLEEINEPTTLMVTNVDLELYEQQYEMNILAYGGGWRFKATRGLFDAYIDKWSKIKAESTGGKREIAKLHLNALYGKFAARSVVTGKYPVMKDNVVKFEIGEDSHREPVYTAMGVFITSYARDITVRAAQANYGCFAYADTDSLHLLVDEVPDGIEVHPTKLGAWKFEYAFDCAYFIRPKAYLERKHDGSYKTAIAGVPEKQQMKLTFDSLKPNAFIDGRPATMIEGKLQPKTVPGGVVLKEIPFELKL